MKKKILVYLLCMALLIIASGCHEKKQDDVNLNSIDVDENTSASSTSEIYEEPTTAISDYESISNELNAWWFKRNNEHKPSGCQDELDISRYDAFFVTQTYIRDNIDIVKRMKEEGHMVCNHTITHPSMPDKNMEELTREITGCANYMYEVTGYHMDMYLRPPKGEYSERTLQLTKDLGYKTVFWSMAYLDYDVNNQPGVDYVVSHFEKYYHPGAIPLIHNVSSANAGALDNILSNLDKEGYRFGLLDELSY